MNLKKFIYFFIIIFINIYSAKNSDDRSYEEIKKELTQIVSQELLAKEYANKYSKHIENKTRNHVKRRVFNESKNYVKNKVYNKNKPLMWKSLQNKVFVYKVPNLPFYSQPFMQKNILAVDLNLDFVDSSFGDSNNSQDLSVLLFGKSDLKLKDILLASKLMKENKIYWQPAPQAKPEIYYNPLHYYYILADQPLNFDASYEKQTVNLNLARHFHEGDITIGMQVPFVRRHNSIRLDSQISAADKETLRLAAYDPVQICPEDPAALPGPNFADRYGTLEKFLIDILDAKGIKYNTKETELGFGDLSLFVNAEFNWNKAERVFAGINFVVPTARSLDLSKFWDPELGNGGFLNLQAFGSVLFSHSRWNNPYMHASLNFGFPKRINSRVSTLISYDGVTPVAGDSINSILISPKQQIYARGADGVFTDEPDATARFFGDATKKIRITPGPKLSFKIGNIFERFLERKAFLDFYYNFGVKLKDCASDSITGYYTSILTNDTWSIENQIGASYNYQLDENFRFNLGVLYTFAGANVEELFRMNFNLSYEF